MVANVGEDGGDETEKGFRVWEDASDAGAALDLLVDAFGEIGGP